MKKNPSNNFYMEYKLNLDIEDYAKYFMKINLIGFLLPFCNVPVWKYKITQMAHITFLLGCSRLYITFEVSRKEAIQCGQTGVGSIPTPSLSSLRDPGTLLLQAFLSSFTKQE